MSDPNPPAPRRRRRSRTIVGEKVNPKAKPSKAPFRHTEEEFEDIDNLEATTEGEEEEEYESKLLSQPSRGGPRSSSFLGRILSTVFIRLFRLSVKFIPIVLALAAAGYGYTYFFGSIPILDSLKTQLGIASEQPAPEQSRVTQMLQQTRDSVAASDSRVHLGNAIASGDIAIADAIETGELTIAAKEPVAKTAPAPIAQAVEPKSNSMFADALDTLKSAIDNVGESDDDTTNSEQAANADFGDGEIKSPYDGYKETVTVVQGSGGIRSRYRDINYQTGPAASEAFRQWAQAIKLGHVTYGFRPSIELYGQPLYAGTLIDFALGVTFEGLADNDTVAVFKEKSGAHLAIKL